LLIAHWLVIHLLLSYSYWTIIPISLYRWLQDYTLVILTFSILGAVNVNKSTHFHFIPDYRAVSQITTALVCTYTVLTCSWVQIAWNSVGVDVTSLGAKPETLATGLL